MVDEKIFEMYGESITELEGKAITYFPDYEKGVDSLYIKCSDGSEYGVKGHNCYESFLCETRGCVDDILNLPLKLVTITWNISQKTIRTLIYFQTASSDFTVIFEGKSMMFVERFNPVGSTIVNSIIHPKDSICVLDDELRKNWNDVHFNFIERRI